MSSDETVSVVAMTTAFLEEERYENIMDSKNTTKDWIMVNSPLPMATVLLLYGVMLWVGPRFMAQRAPYKLKTVMRIYNIVQVFHNMYMIYSFIEHPHALLYAITRSCSSLDKEDSYFETLASAYLYYSWNYLLSKHIDLLDTVFMVLRKKNSHITFLHVYHHGAMVFFTWLTLSYTKSHHAVIPGLINVIVHTVMYSYYFLATFKRFKRFLWWKRHLTKIQLSQFVVILLYICLLYYYGCPMSRMFTFVWMFNVFVILLLFINFYVKAYIIKSEEKDKQTDEDRHKKCT